MRSVCLMPIRNEDWILGLSARAVLMWCDELILGLHACADRSLDIASDLTREYPGRVITTGWSDPVWTEMAHRQKLLNLARGQNATHIVMVDADEVLSGNLTEIIWDSILCARNGMVVQLPWLCLKSDTRHYITCGMWAEQDVSIAFRDDAAYHWQSSAGEEHFHHRHPKGRQMPPYRPLRGARDGGLMHLQFLSERRLRAKQALYQITERIRWPERQPADYARTVREAAAAQTAECPASWWAPYAGLMRHLHVDAEPWQERECQRLVAEHGRAKFAGLDLFGVV